MLGTKCDEAFELARMHYEIEEGLTQVYRVVAPDDAESSPGEPIKLLEVNDCTDSCGILPVGFGPRPQIGIHHPSIIIEVTSDEFRLIRGKQLDLPNGWQVADLIPKPEFNGRS